MTRGREKEEGVLDAVRVERLVSSVLVEHEQL
jgi:hypothetical protein